MTGPGGRVPPVAHATAGMTVVDRDGAEVGTVELVRMGDPQAVTTEGQEEPRSGLVEAFADTVGGGEPDLPPPLAARLLRTGFLKVDCAGLFAGSAYASATDVTEVTGDMVQLSISRDALVKKS